jgi:alkanesulfonate monooxygenase SsuD/methylene tetrahydromethanopterin reductase-like flavin-dependent oxidoreductase (luciferase family)
VIERASSSLKRLGAEMDRPRSVAFGISFAPVAAERARQLSLSQSADQLGLDFVGIQDHPYVARFFDTWTLIAWLAARTERVRFVPDVANLPLRGAAILAKSAATLDLLSEGRVELGLGAGAQWDRIAGMGGPRRSPAEAVASVEEAIDVMRAFWSGAKPANVEGRHYWLRGVHPGPRPAHDIEIWIGAYRPRMLDLIGRKADGWLPSHFYLPPERLPDLQQRIDDAAARAGRHPNAIRRAYNVGGAIGERVSGDGVAGPVELWADTLAGWTANLRMSTYIFWPSVDPERQVRLFAEEVVPAVKERVDPWSLGAS